MTNNWKLGKVSIWKLFSINKQTQYGHNQLTKEMMADEWYAWENEKKFSCFFIRRIYKWIVFYFYPWENDD